MPLFHHQSPRHPARNHQQLQHQESDHLDLYDPSFRYDLGDQRDQHPVDVVDPYLKANLPKIRQAAKFGHFDPTDPAFDHMNASYPTEVSDMFHHDYASPRRSSSLSRRHTLGYKPALETSTSHKHAFGHRSSSVPPPRPEQRATSMASTAYIPPSHKINGYGSNITTPRSHVISQPSTPSKVISQPATPLKTVSQPSTPSKVIGQQSTGIAQPPATTMTDNVQFHPLAANKGTLESPLGGEIPLGAKQTVPYTAGTQDTWTALNGPVGTVFHDQSLTVSNIPKRSAIGLNTMHQDKSTVQAIDRANQIALREHEVNQAKEIAYTKIGPWKMKKKTNPVSLNDRVHMMKRRYYLKGNEHTTTEKAILRANAIASQEYEYNRARNGVGYTRIGIWEM